MPGTSASKVARCAIFSWFLFVDKLRAFIQCREFNKILKEDRATYGTAEDYEIADTVVDEWQQRVDDVVGGTA